MLVVSPHIIVGSRTRIPREPRKKQQDGFLPGPKAAGCSCVAPTCQCHVASIRRSQLDRPGAKHKSIPTITNAMSYHRAPRPSQTRMGGHQSEHGYHMGSSRHPRLAARSEPAPAWRDTRHCQPVRRLSSSLASDSGSFFRVARSDIRSPSRHLSANWNVAETGHALLSSHPSYLVVGSRHIGRQFGQLPARLVGNRTRSGVSRVNLRWDRVCVDVRAGTDGSLPEAIICGRV